jgi:hypothetical protein
MFWVDLEKVIEWEREGGVIKLVREIREWEERVWESFEAVRE